MKNGFIVRTNMLSGVDWHDTASYGGYLCQEGRRPAVFASREEATEAIARDVHAQLADMKQKETYRGRTTVKTLHNPPSLELVRLAVVNKKLFDVNPDGELSAEWNGKHNTLIRRFMRGQLEEFTNYSVIEITPDMRVYVIENFLCPRKGVPSVNRIRSRAYKLNELDEALARLDEVQEDLWGMNGSDREMSRAELAIFDAKDADPKWLADNLRAFELHEAHPEKDDYRLWADMDIEYLNE